MARNDILEGFAIGNQIAENFQRAMLQKQLLAERKRQRALDEAMLRQKNPGLYIAPEDRPMSEAEYGELKGQKIPTAGVTNFRGKDASGSDIDEIKDLGGGVYHSQSQANAFEDAMFQRELGKLKTQLGVKNQYELDALKKKLEIQEPYEIRQDQRQVDARRGFIDVDFTNRMNLLKEEEKLARERGDIASARDLEQKLTLLEREAALRPQVSAKPPNESQSLFQLFGRRLQEAERDLNSIKGFDPSEPKQALLEYAPNVMKSDARQRYEQAKLNFITAALRKESGATITPEEFTKADKQYFPQPGDSENTKKQKAANRRSVIEEFQRLGGGDTRNPFSEKDPLGVLQ